MSEDHIWVLVADKCHAKIYQIVKFPKLEEIADLAHPEGRLRDQDLISTKPGRNFQSFSTARSAYEPETDPKAVEALKFANEVSDFLTASIRKGRFNRLYLIADPAFLGLMRKIINPEVKKTILSEIPKDLTTQDLKVIEQHIAQV
ncbi:MAG: host attachment protein [Parachlamydiales bacterium]|jgi:protein required for attachment to host cells